MRLQARRERCRISPLLVPLIAALVATAGCGSGGGAATASATATASTITAATFSAAPASATALETAASSTESAAPESVAATPPAVAPRLGKRDLGRGLTVEFRADGTVVLKGKDRWKGKVETTYEAPEFFRNAVPVLARSFEDAQAKELEKLADELK